MAGIGLADAVRGYASGVAWKQQQDQVARQQQQQQAMDEANMAAGNMLKQDQQQHILRGGDPASYRPPEDLMFRAAETRSGALAKAGLWDQFYENEAKVAPMRLQARAKAVQQYEADRDPVKFVMAVNNSMFNGKDVKAVEKIDGTPTAESADGLQGVEGTKGGVKVTFSDGTSQVIDPDAAAKGIKVGLLDPKQWAMSEAQQAAERLKQEQHVEGQLKVVAAQGKNSERVAEIHADSRESVAATNADARAAAAEIRGQYSKETARIRGEFQSVASKARGGSQTSAEVQRFKALELSARSSMESIRKELASKETLLKDAGSKDRPRIVAAVEALKSELDDARGVHSEIIASMRQPATAQGGLSDVTPRAEPGAAPAPGAVASEPAAAGLAAVNPAQKAASDAAEQQPGQVMERKSLDAEIAKHPAGSDQRKVLEAERDRLAKMPAAGLSAVSKPAAKKPAPDAPREASQRKANTVYSTPKGDLLWTGKGWKRVDG